MDKSSAWFINPYVSDAYMVFHKMARLSPSPRLRILRRPPSVRRRGAFGACAIQGGTRSVGRTFLRSQRGTLYPGLSAGVEVLELGASLGIVSSIILGRQPSRLISYEAVGPLTEVARQVVARNHPSATWELVHCAIAAEGIDEVSFDWSPEYTQGGTVADESAKSLIRVPAVSLAGAIARHRLPVTAWLVMDIEGMEWELAQHQAEALRHFDGIIVECHQVRSGGRIVLHTEVLAEILKAGFKVVARRGQVSVLRRHSA